MRIAVSCQTDNGLNSFVFQHFGRSPFFAIVDAVDEDIKSIQIVSNPFITGHQAGQIPQFIHDQGVDVMLSGGMGSRAIQFFNQYDIEVGTGAFGTVRSTIESYFSGSLRDVAACKESNHHEKHHE